MARKKGRPCMLRVGWPLLALWLFAAPSLPVSFIVTVLCPLIFPAVFRGCTIFRLSSMTSLLLLMRKICVFMVGVLLFVYLIGFLVSLIVGDVSGFIEFCLVRPLVLSPFFLLYCWIREKFFSYTP